MVDKNTAYVYHDLPSGYTTGSLTENEFYGTTHEALQAALDYLNNNGGGVLNVTPGVYTINGTAATGSTTVGGVNALKLYSNITIKPWLSGIRDLDTVSGTSVVFKSSSIEENASIVSIYGNDVDAICNVNLINIKFDGVIGVDTEGNPRYCKSAVFMKHAKSCNITKCEFKYFSATLDIRDSHNVYVDDSIIVVNDGTGIAGINSSIVLSDAIITGNYVGTGIDCDSCYVYANSRSLIQSLLVGITVTNNSKLYVKDTSFDECIREAINVQGNSTFNIHDITIIRHEDVYDNSVSFTGITVSDCLKGKMTYVSTTVERPVVITNSSGISISNLTARNYIKDITAVELNAIQLINTTMSIVNDIDVRNFTNAVVMGLGCKFCNVANLVTKDCFGKGVAMNDCHYNMLINITSTDTEYGIYMINSTHNMVTGSTFKEIEYAGENNICDPALNNQLV